MTTTADHDCEWKTEALALRQSVAAAREQNAALEARLDKLERALFGKKSEKQPRAPKLTPPVDPEQSKQKRQENAETLQALPEVRIEQPVPDDHKACPKCGGEASRPLPPKLSEQWEYVPGHFEHRVHVRHVLACGCGEHIVTAPVPAKVIDRGRYGPSLCAHAVVSKCADAIPLHRLAKMFARAGVPVSDRTLGELFHSSAELLMPIYDALMKKIAADEVVQADETPLQVQAPGKTKRAYVWTFLAGVRIGYRFSPSRSGLTPLAVLGGTNGTLVVDAYTGYNATCTPDQRERAACLAHVRRKFHDAQSSAPEAAADARRLILAVYRVVHEAKNRGIVRSPAHRELRQTAGKAAMETLHAWLMEQKTQHLPKGPMGQTISYALGQWPALQVFLENPAVPIDNNASERALRIVALGRKNFLFVGNDVAGHNLAVLMSLVRSCEAVGVNPHAYLADVLMRGQDWPAARVEELLPENWVPAVWARWLPSARWSFRISTAARAACPTVSGHTVRRTSRACLGG